MILQKYKTKRKLGKGAYGDVLLCEDMNGRQVAVKVISKKIIKKDPYLEQYLEGQKDVMLSVKDRYVVQLYNFEQDQKNKYFVCQYCDGGDLLNYQASQPNRVFTLKLATQILSQVILGLQMLHSKGYLHRDIKPANIILKKTKQPGKFIFKLADFGFAKKSTDVGGTVLGTQTYMSPQIFSNQVYGYQIDMWAFGVLFYFMLNMDMPFVINPHASLQMKRQSLMKQATNFSYAQCVNKSKKRLTQNCIPQVQDLFRKMFDPNPNTRITFVQIREHPLFQQYFPVIQNQSRILYKTKTINRYDSFLRQKMSGVYKPAKNTLTSNNNSFNPNPNLNGYNNNNPFVDTSKQLQFLQTEFNRIQFLLQASEELVGQLTFIDQAELIAFRYLTLKYYGMLLRDFRYFLQPEVLYKKYGNYNWNQVVKTQQFAQLKAQLARKQSQFNQKLSQSYTQSLQFAAHITPRNPSFPTTLQPNLTLQQFSGPFKQSYRQCTSNLYAQVRQHFSQDFRYVYLTTLVVMCHAFSWLINCNNQELGGLFGEYVAEVGGGGLIGFLGVKKWLAMAGKEKNKNVIKAITRNYV